MSFILFLKKQFLTVYNSLASNPILDFTGCAGELVSPILPVYSTVHVPASQEARLYLYILVNGAGCRDSEPASGV